jgi:hypothetical protein
MRHLLPILLLAGCPKPTPISTPEPAPEPAEAASPLAALGTAAVVLPAIAGPSSVSANGFVVPDPLADDYDRDALLAHCASTGGLIGGPGAGWAHIAIDGEGIWLSGHPVVALEDGAVPESAFDPEAPTVIDDLYDHLRSMSEEADALREAGCALPASGRRDRKMVLSVDGAVRTSVLNHVLDTAGAQYVGTFLLRTAETSSNTLAPPAFEGTITDKPVPVQVVIGTEGLDVRTGPVTGTPVPLKCAVGADGEPVPCTAVADLDLEATRAALAPIREANPDSSAIIVLGADVPTAALATTLAATMLTAEGGPLFPDLLLTGGTGDPVAWTVADGEAIDPLLHAGQVIPGVVFRLPSFTAPPRKEAGASMLIMGPLPKSAVASTIGAAMPEFTRCHTDNALAEDPTIGGRLVAEFTVGVTGAVFDAAVASSQLEHEATHACLLEVLGGLTFPTPAEQAKVQYTFEFAPAESE